MFSLLFSEHRPMMELCFRLQQSPEKVKFNFHTATMRRDRNGCMVLTCDLYCGYRGYQQDLRGCKLCRCNTVWMRVYIDAVQLLLVAPSLKSGATYLLGKTSVCLFDLLWTLAKLENFVRFQKFQTKICFRTF